LPLHSLVLATSGDSREEKGYLGRPQTPKGGLRPLDPRLTRMPMGTHKGCPYNGTNTPRKPLRTIVGASFMGAL